MIGSLNDFINEYKRVSKIFPNYVNDIENVLYLESVNKLTELTQYFLNNIEDAKIVIDTLINEKDDGILAMISQLALTINYKTEEMTKVLKQVIIRNQNTFFGTYLKMKLNDLVK